MAPLSSIVQPNDPILVAQYNDLRADVLDEQLGHDHTGLEGGGKKISHDNLLGVTANQHHLKFVGLLDKDDESVDPDVNSLIKITSGNGLDTTAGESSITISILTGNGITLDGNTVAARLHSVWSGLEFDSGMIRVDQDAAFSWTNIHRFAQDVIVDTDTLFVDVSEDAVYINAGQLPAYRGALTIRPANIYQRGLVIQGLENQNDIANLFSIKDYTGRDQIIVTNTGYLQSGNPGFVSGLTGWRITPSGDAEFNNIVARGELHASVFVADEMNVTGGTLAVMTPVVVDKPKNTGDNRLVAVGSNFNLIIKGSYATGGCYVQQGDVVRLKFMTGAPVYVA